KAITGEGHASLHLVPGLEAPADAAGVLVERVDLAPPVADVDAVEGDERRRLRRPDPLDPARLAVADRERDDLAVEPGARLVAGAAVEEARVDGAPVERGRGGRAAVRGEGPGAAAGLRADGEEVAGVVREEEAAVAGRGRGLEQCPGG